MRTVRAGRKVKSKEESGHGEKVWTFCTSRAPSPSVTMSVVVCRLRALLWTGIYSSVSCTTTNWGLWVTREVFCGFYGTRSREGNRVQRPVIYSQSAESTFVCWVTLLFFHQKPVICCFFLNNFGFAYYLEKRLDPLIWYQCIRCIGLCACSSTIILFLFCISMLREYNHLCNYWRDGRFC